MKIQIEKVDLDALLLSKTVQTSSRGSGRRWMEIVFLVLRTLVALLSKVTFRNVDEQFLVMFRVKNKASEEDLLVAVDDVLVTEGSCESEPRS